MGYYTRYTLTCSDPEVLQKLRKKRASSYQMLYEDFFEFDGHEATTGELKWYEHEADMRKLSKKFKDVIFTLRGEGEESEDIWVKYYQNGKQQIAHAQITFEEFDPNKLA